MQNFYYKTTKRLDHLTDNQLADLLVEKAKAAGSDNMGVVDNVLIEAAYRLDTRSKS